MLCVCVCFFLFVSIAHANGLTTDETSALAGKKLSLPEGPKMRKMCMYVSVDG